MSKDMAKILISDDEPNIVAYIEAAIALEGHTVITASDGDEGLQTFKAEGDFDLVITDLIMPKKAGIEVIVAIRKLDKDVKIVAISGGGMQNPDSYLAAAAGLGADHVMKKPIMITDLQTMLRSQLSLK